MAEKGLLLDHKIRLINAIGNATIAYGTKLMHAHRNTWLKDLDSWLVKVLNKMGRLAPHPDKAYWATHRGLHDLYINNTASYA